MGAAIFLHSRMLLVPFSLRLLDHCLIRCEQSALLVAVLPLSTAEERLLIASIDLLRFVHNQRVEAICNF